ncbi:MAG: hypothetical protein LBJ18_01935 [Rickettsiales bacterium]|jgi:hypothetical protein|nr:hypothetical protein [Rickettsiales bacterium]
MNAITNNLIDTTVQCWGCPVFDRLFQVISSAAAAVYRQFSLMCILIFCVILAFYILHAVWKNIRGGLKDYMYEKSIKPVLINSLFVFALLGLGTALPRFITTITFEPVADMTLVYTQSMLKIDTATVEEKVVYQPQAIDEESGFYRPQLRDKIIMLMKTTITQFQSYMKLGFAVMDNAFSWGALTGIGMLIKHIMMFALGLYLVFGFFKLFIRFCFYFADVIVAMTFFAFMFPLSVVMFAFSESEAAGWVKDFGKKFGAGQFKNVINAIIALAACVLTYTVIMVIIAKFFSAPGTSAADLMGMITSGHIYASDLSDDNLESLTLAGSIILVYLVNFLAGQVPEITKKVLAAFSVSEKHDIADGLADDVMKVGENMFNITKKVVGIATGAKPEEKKEEKKS